MKKKEREKLSPEEREKKDSSAKSLNDIKKSKRKSAKKKVIPGGTKKKESSSKSLNDVKKSIRCFPMTKRSDQNVVLVDQNDLLDDQNDVLVDQKPSGGGKSGESS